LNKAVHSGISGNDEPGFQEVWAVPEIGYYPAGFLHQQTACRDIPGTESHFPEGIEAPGGNVAQIHGSGAQATGAGGMKKDFLKGEQILGE